MDNRDRATPVALSGNTPVSETEIYFSGALAGGFDAIGNLGFCGFHI